MNGELITGLLLTAFGSLLSVLALVWEKAKENRRRIGWTLWLPMLAAVLGTGFTAWQLIEDSKQSRIVLSDLRQTLEDVGAIMRHQQAFGDSLAQVTKTQKEDMAEQERLSNETCITVNQSIERLDRQAGSLNLLASDLKEAIDQIKEARDYLRDANLGMAGLRVTYSVVLESNDHAADSLRGLLQDINGSSYDDELVLPPNGSLAARIAGGPDFLDTCLAISSAFLNGEVKLTFGHTARNWIFLWRESRIDTNSVELFPSRGGILSYECQRGFVHLSAPSTLGKVRETMLDLEGRSGVLILHPLGPFWDLLKNFNGRILLMEVRVINGSGYGIELLNSNQGIEPNINSGDLEFNLGNIDDLPARLFKEPTWLDQ